ncbi:beta-L-arabinofuranosidase domain-containing protein [uncultured Bifidobacterium sp.]|uniref:beta-L-arabinofuranosidase domain-containing protein n=1 Tax=uncultured Bifidobacterium sp. TaxID=165187 RepID=UPI0025DC0FE1|nr:beta-L-arabinofuranosidase domain-containing protein [uncultured Bifidobacterium sp.]
MTDTHVRSASPTNQLRRKHGQEHECFTFAPSQICLAPGSTYADAQQAGADYLLSLDPDRLLAPYRREAGLPHQDSPYPNWESMGLDGHMGGHYLSGLAAYWQTLLDHRFLTRATYMLTVLRECQRASGDGFLGGMPHSAELFRSLRKGHIQAQSFDLQGAWVPLYNLHKLMAGLLDCWQAFQIPENNSQAADASAMAHEIVLQLADWWCNLADAIAGQDFQTMLSCEYGGLNDVFARLYQLTGRERYLRQARRLTDRAFFEPLAGGKDRLTGLHANTQIPKVLGYERLFEITGEKTYRRAVDTFWHGVVDRRTVSIGAHSVSEHFNPPDDFSAMVTSREGLETCNSCNMAKLALSLYRRTGQARYLDFYERVLVNHLVSTVGIHEHGFVYFTPMRPRHYRVYSSAQRSFWCCVGTGLENHARYNSMIFERQPGNEPGSKSESLVVNLFIPAVLDWSARGLRVGLSYAPGPGTANLGRLDLEGPPEEQQTVDLYLRHPWWLEDARYRVMQGQQAQLTVEPTRSASNNSPCFDHLRLTWTGQATLEVAHRVRVTAEPLPDGSDWISLLRGVKVMAARSDDADLEGLKADDSRAGHIAAGPLRPLGDLPLLLGEPKDFLLPHPQDDGAIEVAVARPHAPAREAEGDPKWTDSRLLLVPFTSIEASRYSVYLPWAQDWDKDRVHRILKNIDVQEQAHERQICDQVKCGSQQSEIDHEYQGRNDRQELIEGANTRRALTGGCFSYRLHDATGKARMLEVAMRSQNSTARYSLRAEGLELGQPVRSHEHGTVLDRYPLNEQGLNALPDRSVRVRIQAGNECPTPDMLTLALIRG